MSSTAPRSLLEDHLSTNRRRLEFGARPRKLSTKRSFRTSSASSDNNEGESLSDHVEGSIWAKGRKCTRRSGESTAKRICRSLKTHPSFALSSASPLPTASNKLNLRSERRVHDLDLDSDNDMNEWPPSSAKGHLARPNFLLQRSSSSPLLALSAASLQTLNERVATQETVFFNSFLTLQPTSLERVNKPTLSTSGRLADLERDIVPITPDTANSFNSFYSSSTESPAVLTPSDRLFSYQQSTNLSSECSDSDKNDVMDLDLDVPNLSVSSSSTNSSSWAELEAETELNELEDEEEDDLIVLDGSFGLEGCFGKVELVDELSIMMRRAHLPRPSFSEEDLDPGELFD